MFTELEASQTSYYWDIMESSLTPFTTLLPYLEKVEMRERSENSKLLITALSF